LGSFEQIDIVTEIFEMFKTEKNIILVDPVMADYGKLYSIFPPEFIDGMAKLCSKADIIIPNLTEATLMLHQEYKEGPYTEEYIIEILNKLTGLGPEKIVLTGVYFDNFQLGVATFDKKTNKIGYAFADRIEGMYHGTGDVFGSALVGAILNGFNLNDAAQIAVDFTANSIEKTFIAKTDIRFGVNFEEAIPYYLKCLNKV
ncbi:MAG: bifunctional hydroxymethylpyrimidine kinase/phosphomethylpyrimidine kinase, partial [Bacteroidales bacterium]|nr:bifunctional hydroxymethylpyrimidine kinase/phosphomethylpyrimidine kinase [Bacteroidales bacterium]